MPGLRSYATLAQIRIRQGIGTGDTSDDARLLAKLRAATAEIENYTARTFQPVQETRKHDWQDSQSLRLRGDLLSLTSLVDGAGTVDPTSIILLGDYEDSKGPYYALEIDSTLGYLSYATVPTRAISVTGVWGWHDDYANAWHGTGLTVSDNPLTSGALTVNLSADPAITADAWGQLPAISAGHLIQIDTEWMQVIATASSPNKLTVVRGTNGTTAASHLSGAAISVYEAPRDIQDVCARWAAWLYKQDDVPFGQQVILGMGHTIVPAALPADLSSALQPYRKVRVA